MSDSIGEIENHRAALTGHCYRMLGSVGDAEDAAQETIVRAWRSWDRFEGRASVQTWLYRIATNVCLDTLASRARRSRPMEAAPAGNIDDALVTRPRTHWLEPIPDALVLPPSADPSEVATLRETVRLAFVSALQRLPPKQRAALLLAEVLGFSAAEVAEVLDTSVAAINSALQRARTSLARQASPHPPPLTPSQQQLVERYVDAFERYDVDALTSLLREDATFSMPPYALWLQGPQAVRGWLLGRGSGCRGSRLLPTAACGSPAFGQYRQNLDGGHKAWALVVLELSSDRIAGWNSFLDVEDLFPRFNLPLTLPQ